MKKLLTIILTLGLASTLFIGCSDDTYVDEASETEIDTQEEKPKSLEEIIKYNLDTESIKTDMSCLNVKYYMGDNFSSDLIVGTALMNIKDTLEEAKTNEEFKKLDTIRFLGFYPSNEVDENGESSYQLTLELTFETKLVEKCKNIKDISDKELLKLTGDFPVGMAPSFREALDIKTRQLLKEEI
ncbi:MAG: hypothetical protein ACRCVJ_13085 [Clostridium sp.]|uniref:hypothetical protein n=1 Tax=Clostridium sp. TaxID=1506 RepID=UPI003F2FE851